MKEQQDLVSVIVPLYNQERYIHHCIKSILGQSYPKLEVIVVNDGSTDNSQRIVEKLARRDQRIVLLNQQNKGEALARKAGYERARGQWIMFVDHDDLLLPGAIEQMCSTIHNNGVDVVCGNALRRWGWVTRPLRQFPSSMRERVIGQAELFEQYYVSFFGINLFPVTLWSKLYRRSVIDKAMASIDLFTTPHLHFGGDEAFNLLLFPYLSNAYLMEKQVYLYRWGGLTSGFNRYLPELFDFADFRIGLLDRYHYEKGYTPLFIEYVNVLLSHLEQVIEYKRMEEREILQWIDSELQNRYLVKRMREYYLVRDIKEPDKCQIVIAGEVQNIYAIAKQRAESHPLKTFSKRVLRWL